MLSIAKGGNVHIPANDAYIQVIDCRCMGPIQAVSNAKNRCQLQNNILVLRRERAKFFMLELRIALPMVSGNVGDDCLLILRESRKFCITDQLVGMKMMRVVGNKQANFM